MLGYSNVMFSAKLNANKYTYTYLKLFQAVLHNLDDVDVEREPNSTFLRSPTYVKSVIVPPQFQKTD